MAFKAYLNSKFQTTHENQIFDELIKRLYSKYKDSSEAIALLGNFFYNNREIDAMILKPDGIIIIDFKDYGGTIKFSENGVWTANNKPIKGGSFTNPYRQLRANRDCISNFFKAYKDDVFKGQKNVTWHDLYCLVMFHRKITLENTMPPETRKWFFISDIEDISQASYQITNSKLNLSSDEIEKIVSLLELIEYFPDNLVPNEVRVKIPMEYEPGKNLTKSQDEAMKHIEAFLSSDFEKVFILKGAAGTGKTYLINKIIDLINQKEYSDYSVLAPTGKACVNIKNKFSRLDVRTVHSLIYKRLPNEDKSDETSQKNEESIYEIVFGIKDNEDSKNALYIVDEASLLTDSELKNEFFKFGSDRLLTDFFQFCNLNDSNRKVILIGDDKQINRGKNEQTALTDVYISQHYSLQVLSFELKEVVRQTEGNPIITEALQIRNGIAHQAYNKFNIQADGKHIFRLDRTELAAKYLACLKSDRPEDTIIIKYSNSQVKEVNDWVRKGLMKRGDSISEGDLIMFYRNYYFKDDIAIQNGEVGTVVKVFEPEIIPGNKAADLVFRRLIIDLPTRKEKEITIFESFLETEATSLTKEQRIGLIILFSTEYKKRTGKYPSPKVCESNEKYYRELMNDKYFNSAWVKYAYAITCHKAQGSEWKNVFADFEWKNQVNNFKDQFFRWGYTAITRAKDNFYSLNAPCIKPASRVTWNDAGVAFDESFKIDEFYYDAFIIASEQVENEYSKFKIPADKPFLKSLFTFLHSLLRSKGYRINSFKINNYQLRIGVSLKQSSTELQMYFNSKGVFKNPTIIDSTLHGKKLGKDVLREIDTASYGDFSNALKFEFLREFYAELKSECDKRNIMIINVFQETNCFKSTFKKDEGIALVSFYFEKEGFITTVYPTKFNNKELLEEIKGIVNQLKECNQ